MAIFMRNKPKVEVALDTEALAAKCVEYFIADAKTALSEKDVFYVAVSGGQTPKRFFELLSEEPNAKALPWEKIHLFWVDERIVEPDSKWSNYKLALDGFLEKVDIPNQNIHRIPTEYSDFKVAAKCYEETIKQVFNLKPGQLPQFDLVVLGMAREGHTGSLLPNSYATFDTEDLACVVYVMDEKLNRITLTHPVLSAATHLIVLVSGEEKADILKEVLSSEPDEIQYPIHVLWPVLHKVTWLVDKQAAGKL